MRLEEWFKHVESFEHTGQPGSDRHAGSGAPAPDSAPDPDESITAPPEQLTFGLSDGATFHEAPVLKAARRVAGCIVGSPAAAPSQAMVQRESREQLLARLLDPVLTLEEAATVLNVCPTTVRRYTNRGLLQHYRTSGNQRRFRLSHVLSFLGESGGLLDGGVRTAALQEPDAGGTVDNRKALGRFKSE